jgi:HEAT repeat protein
MPTLQQMWDRLVGVSGKPALAGAILSIDRDKGRAQLDYLRTQVKEGIPQLRLAAATELARVEPKNADLLAALQEYTRGPNLGISAEALAALASMKADAKPALPAIRAHLKSPDVYVRLRAAEAAWRVGGEANEAVPVLTELLSVRSRQPNPGGAVLPPQLTIASQAAQTLGEIGPAAAAALPELRSCLDETDTPLRRAAAAAIKRIAR